jgi:hypothetical protein
MNGLKNKAMDMERNDLYFLRSTDRLTTMTRRNRLQMAVKIVIKQSGRDRPGWIWIYHISDTWMLRMLFRAFFTDGRAFYTDTAEARIKKKSFSDFRFSAPDQQTITIKQPSRYGM